MHYRALNLIIILMIVTGNEPINTCVGDQYDIFPHTHMKLVRL